MPRVRANDIELYYEETGSGAEPIVFVHGYISSHRNWVETLPRLPQDCYRLYAFDLRGLGRSERPASGNSPDQYAEDIAAAMTALGVETFHFVGHSLGGLVGMLFALRHPNRLRKLVLVAPAASGGLPAPEMLPMIRVLCRDASRYRAFAELLRARPLPERLTDIQTEDATSCSEQHIVGCWEAMRDMNISHRLPEITAPTLMVVGDRDGLRPFNLADAARIPHCALHVFYRVNHMIPWEVPQEFVDLLIDFLEHGPAPDPDQIIARIRAIAGDVGGQEPPA